MTTLSSVITITVLGLLFAMTPGCSADIHVHEIKTRIIFTYTPDWLNLLNDTKTRIKNSEANILQCYSSKIQHLNTIYTVKNRKYYTNLNIQLFKKNLNRLLSHSEITSTIT